MRFWLPILLGSEDGIPLLWFVSRLFVDGRLLVGAG